MDSRQLMTSQALESEGLTQDSVTQEDSAREKYKATLFKNIHVSLVTKEQQLAADEKEICICLHLNVTRSFALIQFNGSQLILLVQSLIINMGSIFSTV